MPDAPVVLVDGRKGSGELADLITEYGGRGIQTSVTHLDFADFAFLGNGPTGTVSIGIERKTVRDLLGSMESGRLTGHQIPGLFQDYDYVYLLVEGPYRGNPASGLLEEPAKGGWREVRIRTQRFMYAHIENFLTSLGAQSPLQVKRTSSIHETALAVGNLAKWWAKSWKRHQSLKVLYNPLPPRALMKPASVTRMMAVQVPGVGWEKSAGIDAYFKSPESMVMGTEREWQRLPGIGPVLAKRIVNMMRTGRDPEARKQR